MNNLLLDTNIILDLLARRIPFYDSAAKLFSLADLKKINLSISALSIVNTHYILCRQLTENEARRILRTFKVLVNVFPLNEKIADLALNSDFEDFEDAIQYYTALEQDQDMIVTRNVADFRTSEIPVMTAAEFISLIT